MPSLKNCMKKCRSRKSEKGYIQREKKKTKTTSQKEFCGKLKDSIRILCPLPYKGGGLFFVFLDQNASFCPVDSEGIYFNT